MKFKIEIPQDIGLIHTVLKYHNHNLYICGGAVRDSLLKTHVKDYDLVTDALPDRVIELLKNQHFVKNILETGKAFGVVNVITIDDNEYEIATMREDVGIGRRPDSVIFTNIETDVKRRDLTCNALFYSIETEEIVDLVGGIKDIENKVVKTVGKAEDRFNEDRLRILRAIRFAARFNSELDIDIHHALMKDSRLNGFPETPTGVKNVSNERIRDEFIKGIQSAKSVKYFLELIGKYDLYQYVFKGLEVNYEDGYKLINEKDHIIVIAYLLKNNSLDNIQKQLNKLNYTVDEVKMIKFLIKLNTPSSSTYLFKKAQLNTQITDEQILKFGKLLDVPELLLNVFIEFKLTITGEFVMNKYNLKEGKDVGDMIELLENQIFRNLLEKKSYEKGLF